MKAAVFLVSVLALSGAGCSNSPTPTTPSTPTTPTITTETFTSTVSVQGATSHAFVVTTAGTITVTLLNAGTPSTIVGLGIGIPNANGANCNLSFSLNTTSGATAQITKTADPGLYCVDVFDVGRLTADVGISVQIVHP
jgi:hypothetical protein